MLTYEAYTGCAVTNNPILNALAACFYITAVSSFMYYAGRVSRPEDTVLGPIIALSLFTLSAAVMAYVFFFKPFELYFGGKKKEGVKLAFQSVGVFAGITFLLLLILLSGIIS